MMDSKMQDLVLGEVEGGVGSICMCRYTVDRLATLTCGWMSERVGLGLLSVCVRVS